MRAKRPISGHWKKSGANGHEQAQSPALAVRTGAPDQGCPHDSDFAVKFGFHATALHAQFDGDEFDHSIGDTPGDISVTPKPITEDAAIAAAQVLDGAMDVELDAEPATAEFDVLPADPYDAMRQAVE